MTKQRYLDLLDRYFDGVVYNNAIEYVPIGFFTASGVVIPELEAEPDVEVCGYSVDRFYRVFDPTFSGSGA